MKKRFMWIIVGLSLVFVLVFILRDRTMDSYKGIQDSVKDTNIEENNDKNNGIDEDTKNETQGSVEDTNIEKKDDSNDLTQQSEVVKNSEKLEQIDFFVNEDDLYEEKFKETTAWLDDTLNMEKQEINEILVSSYTNFINSLSSKDLKAVPLAIQIYNTYAEKSQDTNINDQMFISFVEFYNTFVNEAKYMLFTQEELINLSIFNEEDFQFTFKQLTDIKNEDYRERVKLAMDSGLDVCRGYEILIVDEQKSFLYDNFSPTVSEPLKKYLELRQEDIYTDNLPYLSYSWNWVSDRLVVWEKFHKENPTFFEKNSLDDFLDYYIDFYISYYTDESYDNFNFPVKTEQGIIRDEVRRSYERFMEKYPDSRFYKIIKGYYEILSDNWFVFNTEAKDFLSANGIPVMDGQDAHKGDERINEIIGQYKELRKLHDSDNYVIDTDILADSTEDIETTMVSTVEEFVNAVGSNRRILLKPGKYNLDDIYKYGKYHIDPSLIENVTNLTIEGLGEEPVEILRENMDVFQFNNVKNVKLLNLRIGHISKICIGGVLSFSNSSNVIIDKSILFGSGYTGIKTSKVSNLALVNSVITECTRTGIRLEASNDISVKNCSIINNNGANVIEIVNSEDIYFNSIEIASNIAEDKYSEDNGSIFKIVGSRNIDIKDSIIENNVVEGFIKGDSKINVENVLGDYKKE